MSWQTDYAAHLDSQDLSEELRLADLRDDSQGHPLPVKRKPDPAMGAALLAQWNEGFKKWGKKK